MAGVEKPTKRKRKGAGMSTPLALERREPNNDKLDGKRVTLGAECEKDVRFIFDTRESLPDMRGKGMWDEISRRYEAEYGTRVQKPTLQMKLSRAVARHVIWPENEVSFHPKLADATGSVADNLKVGRLEEAYFHVRRQRNRHVRNRMIETGGEELGSTVPLSAIEAKLIELGLLDTKKQVKSGDQHWSAFQN